MANKYDPILGDYREDDGGAASVVWGGITGTLSDQTDLLTALNLKAPLISPTFATSITGSFLTASEMLITNGSKQIVSAPVATYPSLTELTYVKGVTSAIQTQLNAKQASITGSDTRVLFFDGANNPAGDPFFRWEKTNNVLYLGAENDTGKLWGVDATTADTNGGILDFTAGFGLGTGNGGNINIRTGRGGDTGNGGSYVAIAANGGDTSGNGGDITFLAGEALGGDSDGGDTYFHVGAGTGAGLNGTFRFANYLGTEGILDFDLITTVNRIFTFNDSAGGVVVADGNAPGTAGTLAGGVPTFTDYYGGNTNALGDPTAWIDVNIGGTTYKIPLYQ